jgi:hypothetical protein
MVDRTLDTTVSSNASTFLKGAPKTSSAETFDAPVSSVFPQGRNSVEARTASDALPSGTLVSVAFEVSAPRVARSLYSSLDMIHSQASVSGLTHFGAQELPMLPGAVKEQWRRHYPLQRLADADTRAQIV